MPDETKAEKAQHLNFGEVTVLERGEKESLVQLASGEKRTVTTAWLTAVDASTDKH